ncbi:MAG TPA: 1-deoxy-D-xylulose-5-phosphate reductoisomerase [Deltaproteobacteria bacterium]|nr:MAG: 1-deoxy-D-xylulose-5-phosphate reductoisomerase [Deltaproteobacteria bacterium GWA2_55_82]OGQ63330.1 MAG: 1-deoxy-D-xylulose-5-phosphate reductoisomerase [Deltaproteobacteria bacterium RIFCSPLOWO2_02_FULL_55_12]OIJ75005.1 MAG: 1-deoxy-D-xylulose-5-phosphate reductoisomerase [Deltaproteobacteria bacterium GWC2_55_46]HBG47883.1 1-deoxy-D-xylulose-5-phosphate reductoisomerase [Deltaproteobacteria bacterium]HCY11854.1 1-deoxy-D-xylulose-5-phosphate reductoisomerase [Deltaproteobacteria bact
MKGLAILGSTGSIGRNTLQVVRMHPERFKVVTLAAGNNVALVKEQAEEFRPAFISVASEEASEALKRSLSFQVETGYGVEGAMKAASFDGVVMAVSAISGAAGLLPTMAAIRAGVDLALANKEALVLAGSLVIDEAARRGVKIIPIDSEHSAVFQSLLGHRKEDVKRIILTASGGPFLTRPVDTLERATPEEALNHPRWKMGRKISIDSATLFNKGLEVIEARWLFALPPEKISVVIHPQSIVHSMVEYIDGSIMAQMSNPDMRGAIAYALSYPERVPSGTEHLGFRSLSLEFSDPDPERFPCLGLAYEALRLGGGAPAALNAADEVAVALFLEGRIPFTGIYRVMSQVLGRHKPMKIQTIEDVIEADRTAREAAQEAASSISDRT